jgi:hypothetical protein
MPLGALLRTGENRRWSVRAALAVEAAELLEPFQWLTPKNRRVCRRSSLLRFERSKGSAPTYDEP